MQLWKLYLKGKWKNKIKLEFMQGIIASESGG